MDFVTLSFLLGVPVSLLLASSLVFRNNNPLANKILCGYILCQLYTQWNQYLAYSGRLFEVDYVAGSVFPVCVLSVSLLYLYCTALTTPGFKFDRRWIRPMILPILSGFLFVFFLIGRHQSYDQRYFLERNILLGVAFVIYTGYHIACFHRVCEYRKTLSKYFSDIHTVRLTWLYVLLAGSLILSVLALVDIFMGADVTLWSITIPWFTFQSLLTCGFSLRQSPLFCNHVDWRQTSRNEIFSSAELNKWQQKLHQHMDSRRSYINPELRLSDLALEMNLKPYELSELINRAEGKNFYEFINSYRVEEVKRKINLPESDYLSLLGIANECGFNSKSVFNETFKKFTGLTPSAFRTAQRQK